MDFLWLLALTLAGAITALLIRMRAFRDGNGACVVVLGDFGRSPRMQYHTLSLASTYNVTVVANGGEWSASPCHFDFFLCCM